MQGEAVPGSSAALHAHEHVYPEGTQGMQHPHSIQQPMQGIAQTGGSSDFHALLGSDTPRLGGEKGGRRVIDGMVKQNDPFWGVRSWGW